MKNQIIINYKSFESSREKLKQKHTQIDSQQSVQFKEHNIMKKVEKREKCYLHNPDVILFLLKLNQSL